MSSPKLRFRDYDLDPDGFELYRAGHRLRLERKPKPRGFLGGARGSPPWVSSWSSPLLSRLILPEFEVVFLLEVYPPFTPLPFCPWKTFPEMPPRSTSLMA